MATERHNESVYRYVGRAKKKCHTRAYTKESTRPEGPFSRHTHKKQAHDTDPYLADPSQQDRRATAQHAKKAWLPGVRAT